MKYAVVPVGNEMERTFPLRSFQMVHSRTVPLFCWKIVLFHLPEKSHRFFTQIKNAHGFFYLTDIYISWALTFIFSFCPLSGTQSIAFMLIAKVPLTYSLLKMNHGRQPRLESFFSRCYSAMTHEFESNTAEVSNNKLIQYSPKFFNIVPPSPFLS